MLPLGAALTRAQHGRGAVDCEAHDQRVTGRNWHVQRVRAVRVGLARSRSRRPRSEPSRFRSMVALTSRRRARRAGISAPTLRASRSPDRCIVPSRRARARRLRPEKRRRDRPRNRRQRGPGRARADARKVMDDPLFEWRMNEPARRVHPFGRRDHSCSEPVGTIGHSSDACRRPSFDVRALGEALEQVAQVGRVGRVAEERAPRRRSPRTRAQRASCGCRRPALA